MASMGTRTVASKDDDNDDNEDKDNDDNDEKEDKNTTFAILNESLCAVGR